MFSLKDIIKINKLNNNNKICKIKTINIDPRNLFRKNKIRKINIDLIKTCFLNTATIDKEWIIKLNKDLVLPLFLLSMIYISLLIVFKKPKFLANRFYILVFLGIFTGILVYYLNEFSISLGKSNKVPLILSIWLPIIMLTSSTFVFVFDKNE